ncbi:MAG: sigma-70 family RNA polymerase sigma factor [bacterium]|nr:sigma-70 family RNA polymerase sigma factor [bacterium]
MGESGASDSGRDLADLRAAQHDPTEHGRRQAASRLLSRYRNRIYLWCFRYLGEPETAQELTQETMLRAYGGLPRLAADTRFDTWLFIVARNVCFNHLRRPRLLADDSIDPDSLLDGDVWPDRMLEHKQDEAALLQLMADCLEPLERKALALRCFECLPVDTITQELDLTMVSGARALLQRARRKLRSALADREEGTGS